MSGMQTGEDLKIEDYGLIKICAKNMLHRAGVGTSPEYTDSDILALLRGDVGLDPLEDYDERGEHPGVQFIDAVAETLGHVGVEFEEPVSPIKVAVALNSRHKPE